ncbi:phage tail assembly chaperone [Pseudomonas laurylsulfatiphila]|uniref:phage tail assembly chaperone n=1 Tax=Pseudomonas laurylsulfatiphila TaxID=2011015 RepID=UPI003D1CD5AD
MACKTETREIRGKPVFVRQWPANKAMAMQIDVLTIMGDDALAFVLGDWNFGNLVYILQRVEKPVFIALVKECITAARVDGAEINEANFDVEFSGDLMRIYSIFSFVLEVNFKDFFVEGLAAMEELKKSQ